MTITPLESWIVERTQITHKSQEALRAYQLEKVIQTLTYAKAKSRFYNAKLKEIDLKSIRSFKAFEEIPLTVPADIKRNAYDFVCVPPSEVERIVTLNTSGTTGDEKRIFFTHEDLNATIDFFQHGMQCLVGEGDKVLVLLPGAAYGSIGYLLKKALALSNIECIVQGVLSDVETTAHCIEKEGITCLVGIPMQILYLSKVKPELFKTHITKVLLSTDYVPDALVELLSDNGQCKVFNHYGMTEMGYGGAVECECLRGYHLRENDVYFEIIDPITEKPVEDGMYGEIVFTTLNRQAMPLIRYRTGDMARFVSQPCGCGTFLRTMKKVLGRMENKLQIDGHEIYLREFDELLLGFPRILDYKLSVCEKNSLHVTLLLADHERSVALKEEVIRRIRGHFTFEFELRLTVEEDDHTTKVTNSMIKRNINTLRNKKDNG